MLQKRNWNHPPINYVDVCDVNIIVFLDFMAYGRHLGTGKLKPFGYSVTVLWKIKYRHCFWIMFRKLNKIWRKKLPRKGNCNRCIIENINSFDLEKFPSTSESIYRHIKHAYYQCCLWVSPSSSESMCLDPLYYGYTLDDDDETLVADIDSSELPENFPLPCICIKCALNNVCPYRTKRT